MSVKGSPILGISAKHVAHCKEAITSVEVRHSDRCSIDLAILTCHLHAFVGSNSSIKDTPYIYVGLAINGVSNLASLGIEGNGNGVSARFQAFNLNVVALWIAT